jgi:branched-chain amino acid transport system permease protein
VAAGVVAGMVAGGVVAFALERVAYRPLRRRGAPVLAYLISAIGVSLFLQNIARKEFGANPVPVPSLFNQSHTVFTVFGAPVRTGQIVIASCAAVLLVALDRFVNKSRLGTGLRAVAQDAETASLMGIHVDRIIAVTFIIGGLLGGGAGFLYGLTFNTQFNMGFLPGIKAFTAAVLGGIGNVRGAVIGGLLLGIAENVGVSCVDTAWRDVIAFSILVLLLMFRPTGILGERLGRTA